MCVLACVSLLYYSPYSQSLETEPNHVLITKKRPFFRTQFYLWEDNLRAKQYSVECKQSSSSVTWEWTLKQTRLMVSAWLAFISKSSACLDHSTVRPCKDFLCLFPVGTIRFLFFWNIRQSLRKRDERCKRSLAAFSWHLSRRQQGSHVHENLLIIGSNFLLSRQKQVSFRKIEIPLD